MTLRKTFILRDLPRIGRNHAEFVGIFIWQFAYDVHYSFSQSVAVYFFASLYSLLGSGKLNSLEHFLGAKRPLQFTFTIRQCVRSTLYI